MDGSERLVDDVERWFVRRGLPHAIEDYSAREDVLTRTVPFLTLVFLVEVVTAVFGDRFVGWAQAAALAGATAIVLASVALVNRVRRRPRFQRPDDIGLAELTVFVAVPAAAAMLFDGSAGEAALLVAVNLGLVSLAFVFAYFGVLPMLLFGLQQVWRRVRTLTQLLARVLPLLLLFVTFVFFNAEIWQVAHDFTPLAYAIVTAAIALAAFGFVAARTPAELDALGRFASWDEVGALATASGAPALPATGAWAVGVPALELDRRNRRNVSVLLFVSFAVQVLLIGLIVGVLLVVLGVLSIREQTMLQWTVQEGDVVPALWRFRVGAATYVLTWEHVAVSGFVAVFAMLQFAVQLLRDEAYRAEFYAEVSGEIREVLAVQALYQRLLAGP